MGDSFLIERFSLEIRDSGSIPDERFVGFNDNCIFSKRRWTGTPADCKFVVDWHCRFESYRFDWESVQTFSMRVKICNEIRKKLIINNVLYVAY